MTNDNKLVGSFERELGADYEIRHPRMHYEADPKYQNCAVIELRELVLKRRTPERMGHSIGATALSETHKNA